MHQEMSLKMTTQKKVNNMNTINKMISAYNHNSGSASRIKYIVIHYVGALGGAKANCEYYGGGDRQASAHYFVGFDGEIWQCVEDADIAWHCGAKSYVHPECRNANSLGIEMCVRKRDTSHLNADDHDWYFEDSTVASAIELTKYLMNKYGVPADHVIRHYDVTGKICPNPYVYNDGSHSWNQFKSAIAGGGTTTQNLYRVRKSWDDAKTQIGAYSNLNNAKNACTNGYTVYDSNGNAVYTNSGTPSSGTSESDFVAKIGKMAQADMQTSGILASVTSAQAILESGYGTTDLAVNVNNIFGMKCSLSGNTWGGSTWDGTSKYTKNTKEQKPDGTEYTIQADFRKYPSIQESLGDHSAYLNGAKNGSALRYAGLKGCNDYKKAIQIIKDGGYATDVSYVQKICNIIERWNLTQYDVGGVVEPTPAPSESWYRVRKSWSDAKTQKGAFHDLTNAKECADENSGYSVFDESGNVVYTGKVRCPYMVKVSITDLNIRTGAGTNYSRTGCIPIGAYTIVEEKAGQGSDAGWGRLKSGAGWISLDFVSKI